MSCVSACGVCYGHCCNGVDVDEVCSDEEEIDVTACSHSRSYNQFFDIAGYNVISMTLWTFDRTFM